MALQVGNVTLNAIAVTRKSDNVFIGYVKRDVNVQGIYGLTTDPSLALSVQDVPTGDGQLVKTLNGHYDNTYPFLGFAANNADLSTMNTNNAFMVSTAYTEPNSPPVAVGNGYSYPGSSAPYSEASIWSRAAGSNVITPTWTDMESHPVSPTVLSLLVSANDFAIAGKPLTGSFFNGEEVIFAIV